MDQSLVEKPRSINWKKDLIQRVEGDEIRWGEALLLALKKVGFRIEIGEVDDIRLDSNSRLRLKVDQSQESKIVKLQKLLGDSNEARILFTG